MHNLAKRGRQLISSAPGKQKRKAAEENSLCFRVISEKGAFVFSEPDCKDGRLLERLSFGTFFFAERMMSHFAETKFGWVCLESKTRKKAPAGGMKIERKSVAVPDPIVRSMEKQSRSCWTTKDSSGISGWHSNWITFHDRVTISCIIYSFLFRQVASGHTSKYQKDIFDHYLKTKDSRENLGKAALPNYPLTWPFFEVEVVDIENQKTLLLRQIRISDHLHHAVDLLASLRSLIPTEYHIQPETSQWWGSNDGSKPSVKISPGDMTIDDLKKQHLYAIRIELSPKRRSDSNHKRGEAV